MGKAWSRYGWILMMVAMLAAAPAHAKCAVMVPSYGIAGTLYKASLDPKAGLRFDKINFSAGYTANQNFVPNSDCTVRWISLIEGGLLGLGGAAIGPGAAVNLTAVMGLGFYNSLVRVLAGYDLANLGADSSGLALGRLNSQNFSIFVGTGINFDFSKIIPALGETAPPAPEPPGYVRP